MLRLRVWVCAGELESVAFTVIGYDPAEPTAGVPVIVPAEAFRVNPAGRAPVSLQM
jgi:hypothetical protein